MVARSFTCDIISFAGRRGQLDRDFYQEVFQAGRKVHPANSMVKMVTTQREKAETTTTKSTYAIHQNSNVQPTSGRNMNAEVTSHSNQTT